MEEEYKKTETEKEKKGSSGGKTISISDMINGAMGAMTSAMAQSGKVTPVQAGNYGSAAVSDETLKNKERIGRLFEGDNAIKLFSDIDAYLYKYNQKAQGMYGAEKGVDDNEHFGPMAQDLAKNPVTSGTVHKDENGYLNVDTRQLTLTNTAMISQLARKVQELEERLGGM